MKMSPILFAVLAAILLILGMILLQKDTWGLINRPPAGFDPGAGKWLAWFGAIGSILLFALMAAGHEMVVQRHVQFIKDNAPEPKSELDKTIEKLIKTDHYVDHGNVVVEGADGEEEILRILAKPQESGDANIQTRTVSLLDEDGKESEFTYSVLFNDYSWKPGSDRQFRGKKPRVSININTALDDEYLRRGTQSAPRVYCFGLASHELDELTAEENEKLSDGRGINLCKALFKVGYINPEWQKAIMVGGGYAKETDVADPSLQRVAIIVSVQHSEVTFNVERFVLAIHKLTEIKGLDLLQYSRAPRAFTFMEVSPGEFIDFRRLGYTNRRLSDEIVPIIPKVPSR